MINKEVYFRFIPKICEALTVKSSLRNNLLSLYEADKFRYHKKAKESNYYDDELVIRGTLEREINIKRILGIILCAEEEKPLQIKLRKLLKNIIRNFIIRLKRSR